MSSSSSFLVCGFLGAVLLGAVPSQAQPDALNREGLQVRIDGATVTTSRNELPPIDGPVSQTRLMEPFVSTALDGQQHDDTLAGNRGYGDPLEHNEISASASALGAIEVGSSVTVEGVNIDDNAAQMYELEVRRAVASSSITSIGTFAGDQSEGFETQPGGFVPQIDVFGGQGVARGLDGGSMIVTGAWTFVGRVDARSGFRFMGGAGADVEWVFDVPATRFGGYFSTNAGIPDAIALFFDENDNSLGQLPVTAPLNGNWAWNGWQAGGVGIKRVQILANHSPGGGHIMHDDMEYAGLSSCSIPAPCDSGTDPGTGSAWVVCEADADSAWVSADSGGTYHPQLICEQLGYATFGAFGGTCGNVCGFCEPTTSCTNTGNRFFNGGGLRAPDALGPVLSSTVHWECLNSDCACSIDADCDDGIACTTDTCDAGTGGCSNTPVNSACDDGNVCTTDTCDAALGCLNDGTGVTIPCDDGDACTQTDTCQAGACTGSNPVVCIASDQCHVSGTCDTDTGICDDPPAGDGTGCDDGDACTQTDTCQAGACSGGNAVICIASDQCHVAGTCDIDTGICDDPPAANGTGCDDGDACTQTDTCQAGSCSGGNPVICTALDQCHVAGTCDTNTGTCDDPPAANGTGCDDGDACTQTDTCQTGACSGSNPVVCIASDQCHVAGVCDTDTGICDDPPAGDGTGCDDGDACTQTDTCQGGACNGSNPVICTASDQCHVAGTCDTDTGACSDPAATNGTGCDDGDACTQTDTCQTGACSGSNPVVCIASDQCHVAGLCDTDTGICDDPPANDGTGCDDGNACTQTDTCQGGACSGSDPVVCTALDQCHVAGVCDTNTGVCDDPPATNGTDCDDGDACTQTDTCQGGACNGSNPVICTASDQCHVAGVCDTNTGVCDDPPAGDGTGCDDGNACTTSDACLGDAAGTCVGTDTSGVDCDDGIDCTTDTCDPDTGCANTPVDSVCDDALFCDGTEFCDTNLGCQPGPAVCTSACEHCDESSVSCELCILDLDTSGVIGTGDFAVFSPCFGACYAPGDSCAASNFDFDAGGCVGTSDYGGFLGCFGLACEDCPNCAGPGAGFRMADVDVGLAASIQLVALRRPSVSDFADWLPTQRQVYGIDQELFVEIWASRGDDTASADGFGAVFVDVFHDPSSLTVREVVPSASFATFAAGEIDAARGVVRSVGGGASLGDDTLGVGSTWVRVATLRVRTGKSGRSLLTLGASNQPYGVSVFGRFGDVAPDNIDFGEVSVTVQRPRQRLERK